MKTEKAIQILRDYNLWRRGDDKMEQPDPWRIGEAIDSVLVSIQKAEAELDEERKEGEEQARLLGMSAEREAKLIAERDRWRAKAQRWEAKVIDLGVQIDLEIQRLQWKQRKLELGIKELKGDY
jgi:hypothetical protein